VARLITNVSTGKRNPRIATGLEPLLGLQLSHDRKADLDVRVGKTGEPVRAAFREPVRHVPCMDRLSA
jgi:hypothetical protein